jgi:hypothetical protein
MFVWNNYLISQYLIFIVIFGLLYII